tara:strand:+ start:532 stop:1281 length:750 start_codon:yes stop_codon:yes gene_type:complete
MFKSSRKKLIAIGCSFTERDIHKPNREFYFPMWPQHLADMLDMDCVNLGNSGAGNDYILAKTVDATLKEKNIGLVVLMWSEWRRVSFQCHKDFNRWTNITDHGAAEEYIESKKYILEKQNNFHATRTTMRTFIHAEKILSDIPYMFIQGTRNVFYRKRWYMNHDRSSYISEILKSPYLDYIENNISDKFIGWPAMIELGGYCISDILDKKDPSRSKFRISKTDHHPNAAGHKFMADFLYDKYKEIYNEH